MRHTSLRRIFAALLLTFLLQAVSLAQNPDPQATPPPAAPRNDDVEEKNPPAPATDPATGPIISVIDGESDSPDLPFFALGMIDAEEYLRMRDQHTRFLRGLMDKHFDPRARGRAIHQMREQERSLRESVTRGKGKGSPTGAADAGTGGNADANAPTVNNNAPLPPGDLVPWTPLGPAPMPNGQTTAISTPVSGRVTAIVVHPANENIVYVGTAQGGLYRSLDGGTTWTALMDDALSLAIGSIAIDPLDSTTLFVGTGEGNLSGDSFFGVGLYIIKNAETTPTLLGPFNLDAANVDVFTGRSITKVLVSPTDDNIVFVSTISGIGGISADSLPSVISANLPSRGLYRSTNAMSATPTFTKITVQPANGGNRGISDLAFDPADPNVLLAAVVGFSTGGNDGGIWRSTNALAATPTFTNQQVIGTAAATLVVKFATNRVGDVTTVLAATGETSSVTNGSTCGAPGMVRRSLDGGITFNNGIPQTQGFCNGQCFYDIAPAMAANDSNVIYLGGAANANTNPPRADCKAVVLSKATDGLTFSRIDTGLHADTHAVAVSASNPSVVYFGSDGGVWRSSNAGTSWQSINTAGFNATQFQSIAVHPTDRNFTIGGTQDNGTPFFHPDGTWTRADFGDGGFALIDQSAADTTNVTMYHTYFNQSNNLIGYGRVTTTANAHDNGWGFFGCNGTVANNGFRCADAVLFYAPMTLGPGTPNTLYFGTDRLYRSANQGVTMTLVSQGPFVAGAPVSAIGVSHQDDNVRIVGLRNGRVFATTTGANPLIDVTNAGFPAKYVSRAVIDPNDSNTAYAAFAGFGIVGKQIWKTTNLSGGAATWVQAANGIPDVPVSSFAVDPVNSQVLYAGTDIGVFISRNGGTSWDPYGTGLPRVAVFDMAIQNPNRLLRIATHGRGAWEIGAAKSQAVVTLTAPASSTYGDNVTFTATVSAGGVLATPSGNVTFTDGGLPLGTVPLDGSQQAAITTSLLSAGTHSIVATFNGDTIFDVTPSAPSTVLVNPAPLTVTAENATRQYGLANPAFTGTIAGIKNGDNITATYSTAATPASPVGTYPIVPALVDPDAKLGNYTVTVNNGVLTVTPAPLSATANNKTRLYGQSNPPLDGTLTGVLNGDNITATFTTTATPASPVGNYPIVPVLSDPDSKLGNYTVTLNNGVLSVTPAPLSVTANNKTRIYGQPNPVLDGTITGIQNGDNITATFITPATPASPVGNYPIVPVLNDPTGKLGNYTVTSKNGTLTITPAALVITADNKTKILNAPNPPFTASYSGFVLGETPAVLSGVLSCTTTAVTNSPVGSYPITCSGQSSTNYSITYVPGTLKVIYAPNGRCFAGPGHVILPPIKADGSSTFDRDDDVAARFRLCDANGVPVGAPGTVTSFNIVQIISKGITTNVNLPVPSDDRPPVFRFERGEREWEVHIDIDRLPRGTTFVFRVGLNDGSTIDFRFSLKRDRDDGRDRDDRDRDDKDRDSHDH